MKDVKSLYLETAPLWVYEHKGEDNGDDAWVRRVLGWMEWFADDRSQLWKLRELYVTSGTQLEIERRGKMVWATFPNFSGLVERFRVDGEQFAREPFLRGLQRLVDRKALRKVTAFMPDGPYQFMWQVEKLRHRLLPKACEGTDELAMLVMLTASRDLRRAAKSSACGTVFGGILHGETRRAKRRKVRMFVRLLRRHMKGTHQRKSSFTVNKGARAWVILRRDCDGDPKAAWEAMKDNGLFDNYASMLEAIHPFDEAFGLKVRQGRPRGLLGPVLRGFRVSPTQDGAWFDKKPRGERSG